MRFFKLTATLLLVVSVTVSGEEEEGASRKSREKRQQISFYPRRGPRPPPYAVQMEPIVRYSQRDPLYNPLASSKSDDFIHAEDHGQPPIGYYQNEPEPIIEIIIKESNESLPTPVPPPQPPQPRPTKEPIQVFYVKYEKKKGHGDDGSKVIYDTPIPALTPVEEHEELKPETDSGYHEEYNSAAVTPLPLQLEPSTTLRTVIRPDSEIYHAGSSGIRVTFGTEHVPPNQHNKRSDRDQDNRPFSSQIGTVAAGSSKRQHGPYQPIQPVIPLGIHRFPPAHAQQRIVNPFPPVGNGNQQSVGGLGFSQLQFQQAQINRNPPLGRPQQRLPITIQGLPEIQQRVPFNSFNNRGKNINQHQQHAIPQQHSGFITDNQEQQNILKQQEIEKQRYYEQRRQQALIRQQEQNRLQREQIQQRQQEQIRIQEQQRRQQEIEQKRIQEQQIYTQQEQAIKYNHQQFQQISQPQFQVPQNHLPTSSPGGEILKSVPKLEQHYAIRENPSHPGPFPPNPTQYPIITQGQGQFVTQNQQQPNAIENAQHVQRNRQPQFVGGDNNQEQITSSSKQQNFQNSQQQHQQQQQFFAQSLPTRHQQQLQPGSTGNQGNYQSIWESRPVISRHNSNPGQKIYATPVTNFADNIQGSYSTSTPATFISSTTAAPHSATIRISSTTEASTTTTSYPQNEAKIQQNIANLPNEVPDDIREQLLSSGILGNADIQILDYDKVGDIPIENLPPEALANFYGAGGGTATGAASEPVPAIVKRPKITINSVGGKVLPFKIPSTKVEQATLRPGGVEMKVVHFDPNTAQGQAIADEHIREDATHLDPVKIGAKDSSKYNRYLPLKVSGAAFPLPDVPELNGRKITSVVVLAPVDYNFKGEEGVVNSSRGARKLNDVQAVRFLAGDALKQVVKKPNAENYKKWLEQESRADPQRQSVVLLVTTPVDDSQGEKEIFMYDVTTQAVSKLAGDLSTAFVDVAESNSGNEDAQTDIQDASSSE